MPIRKAILLLVVSVLLAACGGATAGSTSSGGQQPQSGGAFETPLPNQVEVHEDSEADHEHVADGEATAQMQVVLVPSELVIGPNRFAVGLFDADGRMVHDAAVHLHYFDLSDPNAPALETEADAHRLQTPDGLTTIFAHERSFDRAGDWGVEVQAEFPDGATAVKRIGFQVLAGSASLRPGDKAPALDTPTAADVKNDLRLLTSASSPNPLFYDLSLAEALESGKPTLLLFATPAFCQTRFCGPDYEIISELQPRYAETVNFIHVEVYTGLPNPAENGWQTAPAMAAFGLSSEPWAFIIDGSGTIVYRVEGLFTADEIERQLQALRQTSGFRLAAR